MNYCRIALVVGAVLLLTFFVASGILTADFLAGIQDEAQCLSLRNSIAASRALRLALLQQRGELSMILLKAEDVASIARERSLPVNGVACVRTLTAMPTPMAAPQAP